MEAKEITEVAEILVNKLERNAVYIMVYDPARYSRATMGELTKVVRYPHGIILIAVPGEFDKNGNCGIKFLDPTQHKEAQ